MQHYLALLILAFAAAVRAHFQLHFPPPRGVFNMDSEPTFCDGYDTPTANRTTFPLSKGFFSLVSEHPQFTTGVQIATENPTSFDSFTTFAVPFFSTEGEGAFCFPLDFSSLSNTTGLQIGQNLTILIIYQGGDGQLYQCADLTLSNDFTIPSDVQCTNATGTTDSTSGSSTASSIASSTAPPSSPTSAASGHRPSVDIVHVLFGFVGASFFIL